MMRSYNFSCALSFPLNWPQPVDQAPINSAQALSLWAVLLNLIGSKSFFMVATEIGSASIARCDSNISSSTNAGTTKQGTQGSFLKILRYTHKCSGRGGAEARDLRWRVCLARRCLGLVGCLVLTLLHGVTSHFFVCFLHKRKKMRKKAHWATFEVSWRDFRSSLW